MVPETFVPHSEKNKDQNKSESKTSKSFLKLFHKDDKMSNLKFVLLYLASCTDMMTIIQLNLLNNALIAWLKLGATGLGIYTGVTYFGNGVVVSALATVGKKYIHEHVNMICATLSGMFGPIVFAFATNVSMFYLGKELYTH